MQQSSFITNMLMKLAKTNPLVVSKKSGVLPGSSAHAYIAIFCKTSWVFLVELTCHQLSVTGRHVLQNDNNSRTCCSY